MTRIVFVFLWNFYPRPPRGGRPLTGSKTYAKRQFLSTPSARRATPQQHGVHSCLAISIHALREEGDLTWRGQKSRSC